MQIPPIYTVFYYNILATRGFMNANCDTYKFYSIKIQKLGLSFSMQIITIK
jgi:hypothetical protein